MIRERFLAIATLVSIIITMLPQTIFAATQPNFDLGFSEGFYSTTSGDAIERAEDYISTLPDEMNVYQPTEPDGKIKIYVAENGSDRNDGTFEKPVRTLARAVEILKRIPDRSNGAVIYMRGGTYSLTSTVRIPKSLSGTKEAPLYITSYEDEEVVISGATYYKAPSKLAVNDAAGYRIKEQVKDKIRVVDLSDTNVYYEFTKTGPSKMSIDSMDFSPARYPNNGYLKFATYNGPGAIGGVVDPGDVWNQVVVNETGLPFTGNTTRGFEFKMDTYKPTNWENHGDMWIYGRMSVDWDWDYYNVDYINPEIPSLKSKFPSDWGCKVTNYNQYYFMNVLEELDVVGEMYLDNETRKLYFYPSKTYSDEDVVTVKIPNAGLDNLVEIEYGAENVVIDGITFDSNSKNGLKIAGDNCVVQYCKFENMTSSAVYITGKYCGVSHSVIRNSNYGVNLKSFNESLYDKTRNIDTYCFVQNNYFEHLIRGVLMGGVSTRDVVSHNTFNALRDQSIYGYFTLEPIIEYNYSVGGAMDVGDSGDMYFPFGARAMKRNTFRYNFFDGDLPCGNAGRSALYFDSFAQGSIIYGNYVVDKNIKVGDKQAIFDNVYIAKDAYKGKNSVGYSDTFYALGGYGESHINNIVDLKMAEDQTSHLLSLNSKGRYVFDYDTYYGDLKTIQKGRLYNKYTEQVKEIDVDFRKFDEIIYKNNLYIDYDPDIAPAYYDWQNQNNIVTSDKDVFVDYANKNYNINSDSSIIKELPSLKTLPSIERIGTELKIELETPSPLFPFNDTKSFVTNKDLIFRWTESSGATYYQLEIAEDENFEKMVVTPYVKGVYNYYSDDMADTGASVSGHDIKAEKVSLENVLKNDTVYYWRVKAYSQAPVTDREITVSDVSSFRVGSKQEILSSEEADTSALMYAIEPYKTYLNNYLVEDDGTDHGFGVYKEGTKELLQKRIDEEEASISKLKYNAEVESRIAKFEEDAYKILSDNAIEYTRKITSYTPENLKIANGSHSITFANDGSELEFGGINQDVVSWERPLTPKEGITFRYKPMEAHSSWNTIGIRQVSSSVTNVLGCHTYFICFSGKNIEIQKINAKTGMDDRIINTVENKDYIKYGEWNDIVASAVNVEDGVHITVTINGQTVTDFVDKVNPVFEIGYASVMWNKNLPKCYLGAVK